MAEVCVICQTRGPALEHHAHDFHCVCQSCYFHPECWTELVEHHVRLQQPLRCPLCRTRPLSVVTVDVPSERPRVPDPHYILCLPVNTRMERFGMVATGLYLLYSLAVAILLLVSVGPFSASQRGIIVAAALTCIYDVRILFWDLRSHEFAYLHFLLSDLGRCCSGAFFVARVVFRAATMFLVPATEQSPLTYAVGLSLLMAEMAVVLMGSTLLCVGLGCQCCERTFWSSR